MFKRAISLSLLWGICICAFPQVSEYEELAIKFNQTGDVAKATDYYNKAAFYYWNNGQSEKAVECFNNVLEYNKKIGNSKGIVFIYNNLGLLYSDMENHNKALSSFEQVLVMSRNSGSKQEIVSALINVGTSLQSLERFKDAISKLDEALAILPEVGDLSLMRKAYSTIAECHERIGNSTLAFEYYQKFSSIDKKIKRQEIENVQATARTQVMQANADKELTENQLYETSGKLKLTKDSLEVTERIAKYREMQIELRNAQIKEKENMIAFQNKIRNYLIVIILGTFGFLVSVTYLLTQKLKDNKKLKLQNEEIERQKGEIELQKNKLDRQNKNIKASISYAQTIQSAILPTNQQINQFFDSFIIYRPKDIVSGDFYWFLPLSGANELKKIFVAVVDCTGHGVPGAFMSLIGSRLLNELVIEKSLHDPSQILNQLNNMVRNTLKQEATENNDGMDLALCYIEEQPDKNYKLIFSGAKRPMYYYKQNNDKIEVSETTRASIGGRSTSKANTVFNKEEFTFKQGDIIFLSSDGIVDQNGPDRLRFGTQRFIETLKQNIHLEMDAQKKLLEEALDKYVSNEEQRDDITVLAIKLI